MYALSRNKSLQNDIWRVINYIKQQSEYEPIKSAYGLKDPYEFVAEFFANSSFGYDLMQVSSIKNVGNFKTLFHQIASWLLYVLRKLGIIEKENASQDEKLSDFLKTSLYYQLAPDMYNLLFEGLNYSNKFVGTRGFIEYSSS